MARDFTCKNYNLRRIFTHFSEYENSQHVVSVADFNGFFLTVSLIYGALKARHAEIMTKYVSKIIMKTHIHT